MPPNPAQPDSPSNRAAIPRVGVGGYLLALALLAGGAATFSAAVIPARMKVRDAVSGLQRITLPGGGTFAVDAPGVVTLYYEKHGLINGEPHQSPMLWQPETLALVGVDSQPVQLNPTSNRVIYRVEPYLGESLFTAELTVAGVYRLGLGEDESAALAPPRVIAVGHVPVELLKSGFLGVYGGAVVLGILFTAAALVAAITWSRRRDAQHACG